MCNMVSQTARLKTYSIGYSICNMVSQTARLKAYSLDYSKVHHGLTDSKVEGL